MTGRRLRHGVSVARRRDVSKIKYKWVISDGGGENDNSACPVTSHARRWRGDVHVWTQVMYCIQRTHSHHARDNLSVFKVLYRIDTEWSHRVLCLQISYIHLYFAKRQYRRTIKAKKENANSHWAYMYINVALVVAFRRLRRYKIVAFTFHYITEGA